MGIEITVLLDVMSCSYVDGCQCFGRTCCLHLQGRHWRWWWQRFLL